MPGTQHVVVCSGDSEVTSLSGAFTAVKLPVPVHYESELNLKLGLGVTHWQASYNPSRYWCTKATEPSELNVNFNLMMLSRTPKCRSPFLRLVTVH
jgi:hypothetical protein